MANKEQKKSKKDQKKAPAKKAPAKKEPEKKAPVKQEVAQSVPAVRHLNATSSPRSFTR